MIKKWATVITWKKGVAQVRCEAHEGCRNCQVQKSCDIYLFKKITLERQSYLEVVSPLPLIPGQQIELGINETSLLRSSFLVYILPLLGLIGGASIFQGTFNIDLVVSFGGMLGGFTGFLYARYLIRKKYEIRLNQLVILQITIPSLLYLKKDTLNP